MNELAQKLSSIDELETWKEHCIGYDSRSRQVAFQIAQKLWVERKALDNTLYLHPKTVGDLEKQDWIPNDLQLRMIWASVIASAEGTNSKQRFQVIKKSLRKKYDHSWWEDVYKRKNSAYAAKERIKKHSASNGAGVNMLISNTHLFASVAQDEVHRAMSMIPSF